ncbi:hypothetical protein [Microbacterium sp. XT11]|uniref:hypothetical protein n=1 Tax=Microbacterium sp. XT11 TaxID=367477 RepID=UPI000A7EE1B7|nr:hypothetical protein [Microbacterium sp. XT11]
MALSLAAVALPTTAHAEVNVDQPGPLTQECSAGGFFVRASGQATLDSGDTIDSYIRVDGLDTGQHPVLSADSDDFVTALDAASVVITDGEQHLVEWIVNGTVLASGELSASDCPEAPAEPAPAETVQFGDPVCNADGSITARVRVTFGPEAPEGAVAEATLVTDSSTETLTSTMDASRKVLIDVPIAAEGQTVVTVRGLMGSESTYIGEKTYEASAVCPVPAKPEPTPDATPTSEPDPVKPEAPVSTDAAGADDAPAPAERPDPPKPAPRVTLSSASVPAGGNVTVRARGFAPGEKVEIWLHSEPLKLTDAVANKRGEVTLNVGIAGGTELGKHRIEVRGASSGSAFVAVSVTDDLAITGIDSAFASGVATTGLILVLGGLSIFLLGRRAQRAVLD